MSQQSAPVHYPVREATDERGLGAGLTSLTASLLGLCAAAITVPLGLLSSFFMLSPYGGTSDRYWIVGLIMGGIPCLLGLLAVVTGIVAVSRSGPRDTGRITGIIGLCITCVSIVIAAFMIADFLGYV